ncbi:N-acetylglucosamine-6-phosphate deacetylase [Tessaracoccus lubricantis]|uniref:N-acetylglucosamine-6-phosphate deacetylase n=1 Tax=Tessaracoccus lubricantis TaxID=545543 RepID=A0ABP9FAV8_9ACTN
MRIIKEVRPGLVDLQVNGYMGHDVNSPSVTPDEIAHLTRALWGAGTTKFLPTIITGPRSRMLQSARSIAQARREDPLVAASIIGIHVEGPHLSPVDGARGAHDSDHLQLPNTALFDQLQEATEEIIRIVTVAPELPGALEYIEHVTRAGVIASIGHSSATAQDIRAAVAAGCSLSTHLGNGIPATIKRHPNQIWSQLAEDTLTAMFITDGYHLPPEAATSMIRAKGVNRSIIVSDSAALAGSPPGTYVTPVGGRVVVGADGAIRLENSPLLAGSGATLLDCVNWAAKNLPFTADEIWDMASKNPRELLGLHDNDEVTLNLAGSGWQVLAVKIAGETVTG